MADTKPCRKHTLYFPGEPEIRPLTEFASGGKHSYCRRCMKFISQEYNRKKALGNGLTPPVPREQHQKPQRAAAVKKVQALAAKIDPNAPTKMRVPEGISASPLGPKPLINTPFLLREDPGKVFAFKSYWMVGNNVTLLGCDWSGRNNWRAEIHLFRLSGIRGLTSKEREILETEVQVTA